MASLAATITPEKVAQVGGLLQKKRLALAPLAAALATRLIVTAGGAWWFLAGSQPASVAAKAPAEAARLSIVYCRSPICRAIQRRTTSSTP